MYFFFYYLAPIIAALTYYILSIPYIDKMIAAEIPNRGFHIFINGVLILVATFAVILLTI